MATSTPERPITTVSIERHERDHTVSIERHERDSTTTTTAITTFTAIITTIIHVIGLA